MPTTNNQLAIANMPIMELGQVLAQSGYFQDSKQAAQAVVKVMAGAELGFPPIMSMNGIYFINGRIAMSAQLMASAIKARKPHYDYKVLIINDEECTIEFFEDGQSVGVSEFTIKDAKRAQTKNLDKYPRNMLFARAISNGAKWYCAGVFGGPVYTPDELDADTNEAGEVVQHAPTIMEEPPTEQPKPTKQQALTRQQKFIKRVQELMAEHYDVTGNPSPDLGADLTKLNEDELIDLGNFQKEYIQAWRDKHAAHMDSKGPNETLDTNGNPELGASYEPDTAIVG